MVLIQLPTIQYQDHLFKFDHHTNCKKSVDDVLDVLDVPVKLKLNSVKTVVLVRFSLRQIQV
jgi:hypothetical protein